MSVKIINEKFLKKMSVKIIDARALGEVETRAHARARVYLLYKEFGFCATCTKNALPARANFVKIDEKKFQKNY